MQQKQQQTYIQYQETENNTPDSLLSSLSHKADTWPPAKAVTVSVSVCVAD